MGMGDCLPRSFNAFDFLPLYGRFLFNAEIRVVVCFGCGLGAVFGLQTDNRCFAIFGLSVRMVFFPGSQQAVVQKKFDLSFGN